MVASLGDGVVHGGQLTDVAYTRLHCFIPSNLHCQLKVMALEGRTNVTTLVIAVLENYVAQHQGRSTR